MIKTENVKKKALEVGFVSIGISYPQLLQELPYGWVDNVINLKLPKDELPSVNSVILMAYYAWDRGFNLAVDSTYLRNRKKLSPKVSLERYQLYYEILKNKAWTIVEYLSKRGQKALLSMNIPLKTAAVKCGLGSQGKNTLLIIPKYGPRIRLISVLTTAKLDIDEQFKEDFCRNCEKCVKACPTKALEPYRINIKRCLAYAAEKPNAKDVPKDVRKIEKNISLRPTSNSYIECTICIDACPFSRTEKNT